MFNSASPHILVLAANLISFSFDIGVFPYPIAIHFPSIQYAISPIFIISFASFSKSKLSSIGISKYISSPHVLTIDLKGKIFLIAIAVLVDLNLILIV